MLPVVLFIIMVATTNLSQASTANDTTTPKPTTPAVTVASQTDKLPKVELSRFTCVYFDNFCISMWKDAEEDHKFYYMPLGLLLNSTVKLINNSVTFQVLLSSPRFREAAYKKLKNYEEYLANMTINDISVYPTPKIRQKWFVMDDDSEPNNTSVWLQDQWQDVPNNTDRVTFTINCLTREGCQRVSGYLKTFGGEISLKDGPGQGRSQHNIMVAFKKVYQVQANWILSVSHTVSLGGSIISKLREIDLQKRWTGNNREGDERVWYVTSEDLARIALESRYHNEDNQIKNINSYQPTGEEVTIDEVSRKLRAKEVIPPIEKFEPSMWPRVYWDPPEERPDLVAAYMNRIINDDTKSSMPLAYINLLNQGRVEWDGTKYRATPIRVHRIDLDNLEIRVTERVEYRQKIKNFVEDSENMINLPTDHDEEWLTTSSKESNNIKDDSNGLF